MLSLTKILVWLSGLLYFVNAGYFVQLKTPTTFEALLKKDDKVKALRHIRPLIKKAFSFEGFEGFAGDFDSDILARLANNPLVAEITPDININVFDNYNVQHDAPRHLVRLSQREKIPFHPEENNYYYPSEYQGEEVTAYVIDTGINCAHPEFENRCENGGDFTGEGPGDRNGHGTHVAGIVGSKTYGVAKMINLIEVKALDKSGSGTLTSIIAGVEYAVKHRRENEIEAAVMNLSVGSFKNVVLNKAIEAAVASGFVVIAAAGNSNSDACNTSPASAKSAITVGAIDDKTDHLASFSNWGRCVDILASGVKIASVNSKDFNGKPLHLSGTSMAAPIITGLAALYLSSGLPNDEIKERLKMTSTSGAISRLSFILKPMTPNRLAYLPYYDLTSDFIEPYFSNYTESSVEKGKSMPVLIL
ncbi:S8 family peptidase [Ascoidea rubescens DSM 1968]|uniref:Putative protease n=1 Tax=Ascoidea rubescens DSM 1968 TaxID=1344418 RepID=A0A1D2VAT9_9ASCO|nr:putative protease [Ascoidea rubescens DSM 1968]ODV58573.1 putative protease [Ascoidea rubescens DSM 1968]